MCEAPSSMAWDFLGMFQAFFTTLCEGRDPWRGFRHRAKLGSL